MVSKIKSRSTPPTALEKGTPVRESPPTDSSAEPIRLEIAWTLGATTTGADRTRTASARRPFPPRIAAFADAHQLETRIALLRADKPGLLPSEQESMLEALSALDRGQLKSLRTVLIEQPPHPRYGEICEHQAIKGPPTAEGLLAILAGEPLGLTEKGHVEKAEGTMVGFVPKLFLNTYRAGAEVAVPRSSGTVDAGGWFIRGRAPSGKLVVESPGAVKLVAPEELLHYNPGLLPGGARVSMVRNDGRIEEDWVIKDPHVAPGMVQLARPGMTRDVPLDVLIDWNPSLRSAPKPDCISDQLFKFGAIVNVPRKSGAIDAGWKLGGYSPASGNVMVFTEGMHKPVKAEVLLLHNPELLPIGTEVSVPRELGYVEDGWKVLRADKNGAYVISENGETKMLPLAELIEVNRDRFFGAPETQQVLAAPAIVSPAARALSEAFKQINRIEGAIPDGFVDGGRGMQIAPDGTITSSREVLVVDRARDKQLAAHLAFARSVRRMPERARANAIADYVHRTMAPTEGNAEDAAHRLGASHLDREVLIGDVPEKGGGGACRHRALLFKLMADEAGLKAALVRGNATFGERSGGHAWNEVRVNDGSAILVDVMNPHFQGNGGFIFPGLDDPLVQRQYSGIRFEPLYGKGAR